MSQDFGSWVTFLLPTNYGSTWYAILQEHLSSQTKSEPVVANYIETFIIILDIIVYCPVGACFCQC